MQLQITHATCYDYAPAVSVAQHVAYLRPLNLATQTLLSHSLQIAPEPTDQMTRQDVYGNTRTFFSLQSAHSQLLVTAHSVVATCSTGLAHSTVPWEEVRERFRYCAGNPFDAAAEFAFASAHVPVHADFLAYARPSFVSARPLLLAARDLMQRIHRDFTYETHSTQINTPAREALAQRKGVCQDFAHIMVACLRACGIPARYVSGYLLTQALDGQPRMVGSDASHAWVSVYLPDLDDFAPERCWFDFDPTNNRDGWGSPGEDYVTLAIGRDYADVSPIRGVIHGGANHLLSVGVTVEPFEVFASATQSQSQSQSPSPSRSQAQSQSQSPDLFQDHDAIP